MVRRRSWLRGWGRKGGVVSPRTRARGSLHLVPLTQILVPLHHLLCSPAAPLSPPSMTHRSLSQCRPALTLTLNHVFYLGSKFHRACAHTGPVCGCGAQAGRAPTGGHFVQPVLVKCRAVVGSQVPSGAREPKVSLKECVSAPAHLRADPAPVCPSLLPSF